MNTDDTFTRDYLAEQIFLRQIITFSGPFSAKLAEQIAQEAFSAASIFIEVKRTIKPEAKKNDDDCNGY